MAVKKADLDRKIEEMLAGQRQRNTEGLLGRVKYAETRIDLLLDHYYIKGQSVRVSEEDIDFVLSFINEAHVQALRDLYHESGWTITPEVDGDSGRMVLFFR